MSTHHVYRAFDEFGLLLYVGCTNDVPRRLAQHRSAGIWHQYMRRLTSEGPFPRDQALQVEAKAIDTEGPHFNAQPEHTALVQENNRAATRLLESLSIDPPPGADVSDEEAEVWHSAWYEARRALTVLIQQQYPIVDTAARTQWYLAEHERVAAAQDGAA